MKLIRHSTVCCALLVLASCTRAAGLEPADVLQRAARAGRDIPAAHFTAHLVFDGTDTGGTAMHADLSAAGRMQHGGQQMEFVLEGRGTGGTNGSWQGKVEVVVAAENDVYVMPRELIFSSPESLPPMLVGHLLNQWWHLPPSDTPPAGPGMTPDPQRLRMQADIVDVVRDRGFTTVHGRSAYHYDVKLNPVKLRSFLAEVAKERGETADPERLGTLTENIDAVGELLIDADTFAILGVQWSITSGAPSRALRINARFDITDFDGGDPILPPQAATVIPLNPLDLLPSGIFLHGSPDVPEFPGEPDESTPDVPPLS